MNIKGRNLQLVYLALGGAISDLRNDIAICPSWAEYEREIEEIEELIAEYEGLQLRVAESRGFILPPECVDPEILDEKPEQVIPVKRQFIFEV
jgi:hypothetical protein